ncbi:hypothetical protein ACMD2_06448, partial [Ananas comosus]
SLLLQ